MNEQKMQFRLGVLVVAVVLIAAIMVLLLGTPETFKRGYPVMVKFENAGGVGVGAPLRNSGILIGRVAAVDLAEGGGAVVTVKIDNDRKILPDQTFQVAFTSVLGDVQLEVVSPRNGVKHTVVKIAGQSESVNVLVGEEPLDPMREVKDLSEDLTKALKAVTKTGNSLNDFIGKTDAMLYGDKSTPEAERLNIGDIVRNLNDTVTEAKKSFESFNDIIGDEQAKESLRTAMNTLPQLVNNTNTAIAKMDTSFIKINDNLANLEKLTERLGDRGPTMVDNVDAALVNVRTITESLTSLSGTLDNRNGTLGRLIHDDSLYNNLNQASKNIRDITVKMKPIINDVRVVSDRMARHPGSIIRDAIRPGSGVKGMPGDFPPSQNACPPQRTGPLLFNGPLLRTSQQPRETGLR